jgi:hypothetical protein
VHRETSPGSSRRSDLARNTTSFFQANGVVIFESHIDLLKTMKERHDDASLSQFAASILVEVEEDEETLRSIAKNIGSGSNIFKEAAAWLAEKASRLKLGASSSGDFGTFEALEFLSLGIQGKLSLWAALQLVSESDARLSVLDFEKLIARAKTQYSRVEERRLSVAANALSSNLPNIH